MFILLPFIKLDINLTQIVMRKIFRDDQFNDEISQNGFVNIDFIDSTKIKEFLSVVNSMDVGVSHDDVHIDTPFRLSAFNNDSRYKEKIYDTLYSYLRTNIDSSFLDYEPLVINIFEKLPGDGSVQIHQNPSFVREPEFKSISVWIPLIDSKKENGTVGVLKGSHNVFDTMRASNMPYVFEDMASELQDIYFDPIELKVGQAVVLDDSVVHWSYPNKSEQIRKAVQLIMVPKEVEHIYHYYDTEGETPKVKMFEVDKSFFYKFK